MHEIQMHARNSFLTLTIDPARAPDHDLDVKLWQTFMKRLRYHYRDHDQVDALRYYHCGEYDDSNRGHYHAILFGWDFHEDRKHLKMSKHGDQLWTSETLTDLWSHGFCSIGAATYKSAHYVARYIMKKQLGDQAEAAYGRIDPATGEVIQVKPPYTTMSRRPGIGSTWLKKYRNDVYPSDEVIVAGKSTRPPRYYDAQQALHNPDDQADRVVQRSLNAKRYAHNNTPERLHVRETIHLRRMEQLPRDMT